jgi:hypothetical protein
MLKVTVNIVDPQSPGKVTTQARIAGLFFVEILFEDDGRNPTPVTFDSVHMEILYNDGPNYIVGSDAMARPLAGEIALSAIDAFSFQTINPGSSRDPGGPYANASLLTLRPRTNDLIGPFRTTTGLAGFRLQNPYQLTPQMGVKSAMGGKLYPAAGAISGTTSVVAVGQIFHGSQPVPYDSVVGSIDLLPLPSAQPLAQGIGGGTRRYPDSFGN